MGKNVDWLKTTLWLTGKYFVIIFGTIMYLVFMKMYLGIDYKIALVIGVALIIGYKLIDAVTSIGFSKLDNAVEKKFDKK